MVMIFWSRPPKANNFIIMICLKSSLRKSDCNFEFTPKSPIFVPCVATSIKNPTVFNWFTAGYWFYLLSRQGSNLNSSDSESDVLPVTPRDNEGAKLWKFYEKKTFFAKYFVSHARQGKNLNMAIAFLQHYMSGVWHNYITKTIKKPLGRELIFFIINTLKFIILNKF